MTDKSKERGAEQGFDVDSIWYYVDDYEEIILQIYLGIEENYGEEELILWYQESIDE